MHAEAPVFFDPRVNGWMVGSHRVTKALEREPRLSAARSGYVSALRPTPLQERVAPLVAWYGEWMTMRDGVIDGVFATRGQIHDYFVALIAERRRAPRDGEILTSLVQAIEGSDTLTVDEIIDLSVFIMTGGYDTTTHLIASGLELLLSHPEQLAAVQADPTKIDGWIEETLRCDPQIAINTRLVSEGFEHEGHRFEPRELHLPAQALEHVPTVLLRGWKSLRIELR